VALVKVWKSPAARPDELAVGVAVGEAEDELCAADTLDAE